MNNDIRYFLYACFLSSLLFVAGQTTAHAQNNGLFLNDTKQDQAKENRTFSFGGWFSKDTKKEKKKKASLRSRYLLKNNVLKTNNNSSLSIDDYAGYKGAASSYGKSQKDYSDQYPDPATSTVEKSLQEIYKKRAIKRQRKAQERARREQAIQQNQGSSRPVRTTRPVVRQRIAPQTITPYKPKRTFSETNENNKSVPTTQTNKEPKTNRLFLGR